MGTAIVLPASSVTCAVQEPTVSGLTEKVADASLVAATKTEATLVQSSVSLNAATRAGLVTRKSAELVALSILKLAGVADNGVEACAAAAAGWRGRGLTLAPDRAIRKRHRSDIAGNLGCDKLGQQERLPLTISVLVLYGNTG